MVCVNRFIFRYHLLLIPLLGVVEITTNAFISLWLEVQKSDLVQLHVQNSHLTLFLALFLSLTLSLILL